MASFLDRLWDNPRGAFGSSGATAYTDEQGNPYDANGTRIPPAQEPAPSLSDSLLNIAESPAKMAIGAVTAPLNAAAELFTGSDGKAPTLWQGPDAVGNARRFADVAAPFFGGEAFSGGRSALADAAALGTKNATERALLPDSVTQLASDTGRSNPIGAAVSGSLPMDEASRLARAREMGFDTDKPLYHGSTSDFDSFEPSERGKMGPGVYMSPEATLANRWAGSEDGSAVYPAYARGRIASSADAEPFMAEAARQTQDPHEWKALTNQLMRDAGFSGKNVQNETVMFDPKDLRSPFAAFNPADSDKAGLLLSDTSKPNPITASISSLRDRTKSLFDGGNALNPAVRVPEGAVASGAMRAAEGPQRLDVWHGSPHNFDQFDMSKIGAGEGAQTEGRGLYFSDTARIAKHYREAKNLAVVNGSVVGDPVTKNAVYHLKQNAYQYPWAIQSLADETAKFQTPLNDADPTLWNRLKGTANPQYAADLNELISRNKLISDRIQRLRDDGADVELADVPADQGYLYHVNVNADPNHFLNLDKSFGDQQPHVKEVLARNGITLADDPDGAGLSRNPLKYQPMVDKLQGAGIPGIKYFDGYSRLKGEGTHNYVVFSDDPLSIMHKWHGDTQLFSDSTPSLPGAVVAGADNKALSDAANIPPLSKSKAGGSIKGKKK